MKTGYIQILPVRTDCTFCINCEHYRQYHAKTRKGGYIPLNRGACLKDDEPQDTAALSRCRDFERRETDENDN